MVMVRAVLLLLLAAVIAPAGHSASRAPVRGKQGMVVSTEPRASLAGVEILKHGGNAVDAAVAVGFALAVTHPAAGNIGGGGFMLIRLADGQSVAVDYREMAPAAAGRETFLDADRHLISESSTVGYRAIGVPGTVAGLTLALERYGTMKLSEVMSPAIRLAKEGVELSFFESESLKGARRLLGRFEESGRVFLRHGEFYAEGERFRQPDLARTLEAISLHGAGEFYQGNTARLIAAEIQAHGGLLTLEDLKGYRAMIRKPVEGEYRGYRILSMSPPSSGGTALLQMLNMLEAYPLATFGQGSSRTLHLMAESMRRAFADRASFLGDADFVLVPVAGLISKDYAAQRRATIDPERATEATEVAHGNPFPFESEQTTHFSVVDRHGNAVSNTYTLNGGYGSGVTVAGTGILMNNEMDDFSVKPGSPNLYGLVHGDANAVGPGKRPLSSMTPTIVLRDGKLFLVLGSPGGPTIINTVLQTILNVVDFGLTVQEAVDAPRIHHQWVPDRLVLERIGFAQDVVDGLQRRGHVIDRRRSIGDCHAIMVERDSGVLLGAADSRNDGRALGY